MKKSKVHRRANRVRLAPGRSRHAPGGCLPAAGRERGDVLHLEEEVRAPQYRDKVPRQTAPIARRIVEHCLEYFVMGSAPKILFIDDQTMEQTDLNDLFTKDILDSSMVHDFKVKARDFKITHVQVATGQEVSHRLNFCAHKRTVRTEHLGSKIPNLTPSLKDTENGERPFVYYGYVSGFYLDETA